MGFRAESAPSPATGFTTIQTPAGTSPVADSIADTLTFTSDGKVTATGNSTTDTVALSIVAGSLVNADVNASAAIAVTKLAAVTASRALASDASGFITPATTTSTELGYVNGVTSAIQTQLNTQNAKELYADVTILHAAILTLNTVPVQVVAAPGSGFTLVPLRAVAHLTYGGTAYATNTTVNIVPAGFTAQTQITLGTVLALTASAGRMGSSGASPTLNNNTALMVFVSTGDPTLGHANSVLKVRVFYTIAAFPVF